MVNKLRIWKVNYFSMVRSGPVRIGILSSGNLIFSHILLKKPSKVVLIPPPFCFLHINKPNQPLALPLTQWHSLNTVMLGLIYITKCFVGLLRYATFACSYSLFLVLHVFWSISKVTSLLVFYTLL